MDKVYAFITIINRGKVIDSLYIDKDRSKVCNCDYFAYNCWYAYSHSDREKSYLHMMNKVRLMEPSLGNNTNN